MSNRFSNGLLKTGVMLATIVAVASIVVAGKSVFASSGSLKKASIVSCGGRLWGQHSSDNHWHEATGPDSKGMYHAAGDIVPAPCYFKDISKSKHASNILWLYDQGITSGTSKDKYSPKQSVTREQMATFLYRLAGSPTYSLSIAELNVFVDVEESNVHKKNIAWLTKEGITSGTSPTTFSPKNAVTREQMATFLYRLAGSPDRGDISKQLASFKDVATSNDHRENIAWLAKTGITSGTSATTFSPKAKTTREQMATFLRRFSDKF